jgi:hypothetical protein
VRRAVEPSIFDQCRPVCKTGQPQPVSLDRNAFGIMVT